MPGGVSALTITYATGQFAVGGSLINLNVYNVLSASASFSLTELTVGVSLDNGVTLSGASLLTIGLSGIQLAAGASGFGISLTSGDLAIALLEPPVAATGTDSRYWLALAASNLAGTLSLGPDVSASVSGGTVTINQAGGADPNSTRAAPIDWTSSLDLNGDGQYGTPADQLNVVVNLAGGGSVSLPINETAGGLLVAGTLTGLTIDGFINASASFAISEQSVGASLGNGVTLSGASLLTVGLNGLTASVGTGPVGLAVTGGDIGLALLRPATPSSGSDNRYWLAITATNLAGTLSLGTGVSASVQGGSIAINEAGGTVPTTAAPINWTTALDLNNDGQYGTAADQVDAGAGIPAPNTVALPINETTSEALVAGSLTALNIDGLLTGSASFALSRSVVNATAGTETLTSATLLTIGLSGLTVAGGAGSFGVSVGGGDLGIAVLQPPATANDNRYWLAVTASGLSGSLNLAGDVTASVQGVTVSINQFGGQDAASHPATALNWTTAFASPVDPGANLPTPPASSLAITATGPEMSLGGTLTSLDVFGFLTGSSGFSISETTVSPNVGGTTLTNATLLTIDLANLQVAAGSGGFGIAINGGNLDVAVLEASGTDNRYWLAVTGTGLAGSLALGSTISAAATGVSVAINTQGGTGAQGLDWSVLARAGRVGVPVERQPVRGDGYPD